MNPRTSYPSSTAFSTCTGGVADVQLIFTRMLAVQLTGGVPFTLLLCVKSRSIKADKRGSTSNRQTFPRKQLCMAKAARMVMFITKPLLHKSSKHEGDADAVAVQHVAESGPKDA